MSTIAELLSADGPWTTAYVDGAGPEPQAVEEARRRSIGECIATTGAPEADAGALADALESPAQVPAPSARVLFARHGEVVLDETFESARLGPERFEHGALPALLPLLRHRAGQLRYLVIETGREGADIRLERAGRTDGTSEEIEGETNNLSKVQAGGLSHARYQRHAEEVWKQNQSDVADAVEKIVRERRPAFIVLAGDVRARQLLREQLSGHASAVDVIETDAHTRPDGADSGALDDAVEKALAAAHDRRLSDVRDGASAGDGAAGAFGVDDVIAALQQARVETLVLDARLADDNRTVIALGSAPWVALGTADSFGVVQLGEVPLAEGLIRAAVMADAEVVFVEHEPDADDAPRSEAPLDEPFASLRWSEDAPEPGAMQARADVGERGDSPVA